MKIRVLAAMMFLAVCLTVPIDAQDCPTIPAEQWTAAPDPSAIPPATDAWLLTYQNTYFRGKANHVVAYVQTGPNEQKVWFYVNSVPHYTKVYFNRRFRASSADPWKWAYVFSPVVLELPSPASVSVNAVLYSPIPKYGAGGVLYNYAMFLVNQPSTCDNVNAGFAMVSYSNNGSCWTTPVPLRRSGGPSSPCSPALGTDLVPVEAFDAIDAGTRIYFIGLEGNVQWLMDRGNMEGTGARWGWALPGTSQNVMLETNSSVSASGLVSPYALYDEGDETRYKPYNYFINMALAWDTAHGDLYLTRGYPYPYDRNADDSMIPSPVTTTWTWAYNSYLAHDQHIDGCQGELAAYPNRIQIYKMHIGSLSNFGQVSTGAWVLMADYGNSYGYLRNWEQLRNPTIYPQQSIGHDLGAASFLRDASGNIQYVDGAAYIFGGTQYQTPLSDLPTWQTTERPCRVTSNERTFLIAIPGLTP